MHPVRDGPDIHGHIVKEKKSLHNFNELESQYLDNFGHRLTKASVLVISLRSLQE